MTFQTANRADRNLPLMVAYAFITLCCLISGATARTLKPTIYDDGLSCPNNCDAHVVFSPSENGTRYAFSPETTRQRPSACVSGHECRICFDESDQSCITVLYRGNGPHKGRFDFTPAFYEANCNRHDLPNALVRECRAQEHAVASHHYDTAINCFDQPAHPRCQSVMQAAKAAREADEPKYAKCLSAGEAAYNQSQTNMNERRTNECAYTLSLSGGNGKWHRLLPAACRPDTYVDRYGLDCCSRSARFAAANHDECLAFFPKP